MYIYWKTKSQSSRKDEKGNNNAWPLWASVWCVESLPGKVYGE